MLLDNYVEMLVLVLLVASALAQNPEQEKKLQVQQQEIEIREGVGLKYGENTQTLTFSLQQMTDFAVKTQENQQIKMTMHSYWKQDNIYISSEYRGGENLRIVIYEDNYRIILDNSFYVTWGIKFTAEKGKMYTIRFLDEGTVGKLVALEMSKSNTAFQNVANADDISNLSARIGNLEKQMQMMASISEFGIIAHEQSSVKLNHSTCIYMSYLLGEAAVIMVIIFLQIRFMRKMLECDSIV